MVISTSAGLSSTNRMSNGWCKFCLPFGCRPGRVRRFAQLTLRQREVKRRPAAKLTLDPDAPSVPLYHALDDGQPNPRPLFVALQPLKYLENLLEVLRLDPHTI